MNCRQADRLMVRHLYGALSACASRAVQNHLAACAPCRRRFGSYRMNQASLSKLAGERPASSLAGAAVHRWEQERARPASRPGGARLRPLAWTAAAAACTALLAISLLFRHHAPERAVLHPGGTGAPPRLAHQDGRPNPRDLQRPVLGPRRAPESARAPRQVGEQYARGGQSGPSGARHTSHTSPTVPKIAPKIDDLAYINADLALVLRRWVPPAAAAGAARAAGAPLGQNEEFIYIEPPRIASRDPGAVRDAVARYQAEKAVVDARLERKVDLAVKGISFSDLCGRLTRETGVPLRAGRTVADEKVTIFCEKQPLRALMRQVSHLFGYKWARSGEEGAYQYELFQELRSQLAEEELRNRDLNAALIALDEAMGAYKPFLPLSQADLLRQLKELPKGDRNKTLLENAARGSFAGIQAYMCLTPAEVQALRAGNEVKFSTDAPLPPGFPADWATRLLASWQGISGPDGEIKVPSSTVTLSLDHTELGEVALNCFVGGGGIGFQSILGVGRSPSAANPGNRAADKELQNDPAFRRRVSLAPKRCLRPDFKAEYGVDFSKLIYIQDDLQNRVAPPHPHLSSADVWEEVHERTGMPIVADYYTHLFPVQEFTLENRPLFDALCQSGDALGVRWRKEGDFVECRSTAFFWNKLKEVPNRLLDRWQADREARGGLPLDDLLEMAELSDQQLDSVLVGQGVKHCRNLMEWNILADPQYTGARRKLDQVRPFARFLAALPPVLRQQALAPGGIRLAAFSPPQQEALARIFYLGMLLPQINGTMENTRLRVTYVPSGMYTWHVVYDSDEDARAAKRRVPVFAARTPEIALAAARKFYPKARPEDIRRSYGMLAATFTGPDGAELAFGQFQAAVRINH
jgi:hypothetical protein